MNEYRLRVNGAIVTDQDFRNTIHPTKMLPAILSQIMLDQLAADPVLPSPQPTPGVNQVVVRVGVQQDALGNWVQQWEVQDIPQDQIAASRAAAKVQKWEAIKTERDGPRVDGGVKVGGAWFHTDGASRTKWLGLKDSARDLLADGRPMHEPIKLGGQQVMWKTMGGTFAPVTVQLAYDVVQATKELDALLFIRAEQHRAMLNASDTPETYNIMTGWPERYGININ